MPDSAIPMTQEARHDRVPGQGRLLASAYDSFTVESDTDTEAKAKAIATAPAIMTLVASPEHIDLDARREGIIAFIDRIAPNGREAVVEDVEFDDDRIHDPPRS